MISDTEHGLEIFTRSADGMCIYVQFIKVKEDILRLFVEILCFTITQVIALMLISVFLLAIAF